MTEGGSVHVPVGWLVCGSVGSATGAEVGQVPAAQSTKEPSGHKRKKETTQWSDLICNI